MLNSVLIGTWVFTHVIQEAPPQFSPFIATPSEGLVMTLQFNDQGQNTLNYYKKGDSAFCKRTADFTYSENLLIQKVTEVDAGNSAFCTDDPDMHTEKETTTPVEIKNDEMHMALTLGEQKLIYVWKPCDDASPGKACEEVAGTGQTL